MQSEGGCNRGCNLFFLFFFFSWGPLGVPLFAHPDIDAVISGRRGAADDLILDRAGTTAARRGLGCCLRRGRVVVCGGVKVHRKGIAGPARDLAVGGRNDMVDVPATGGLHPPGQIRRPCARVSTARPIQSLVKRYRRGTDKGATHPRTKKRLSFPFILSTHLVDVEATLGGCLALALAATAAGCGLKVAPTRRVVKQGQQARGKNEGDNQT